MKKLKNDPFYKALSPYWTDFFLSESLTFEKSPVLRNTKLNCTANAKQIVGPVAFTALIARDNFELKGECLEVKFYLK